MRNHVNRDRIGPIRRGPSVLLLIIFLFGVPPLGGSEEDRLKTELRTEANSVVTVTLNLKETAQPIRNIGASGCWYSENIGRYWPEAKKERIAELLFSRELDASRSPRGIGLSAWRFNIGGGTAEQGQASGIRDADRRVECFLDADGNYDWSKQAGYVWFVKQAQAYGVEDLIAFSNTPPVFFTQNGYGFKTDRDVLSNLRPDKVVAFAEFLAAVVKHFDEQGLHFDYLSPVNEPQWDWSNTPGRASQEGCPWQNEEIHRLVKALDEALTKTRQNAKILLPEAARLDFLYKQDVPEADLGKSRQIAAFWSPNNPLYLGGFSHVCRYVAGHSYFTDNGDGQLLSTRRDLAQAIARTDQNLEYWQSEYCLLGNGYRDGRRGRPSEMDHALFLAKVIHHDLVVGQATAWHYWNAYEPGRASSPRYYLIALTPDSDRRDGQFAATKCLWALGHYSRFVRPGMKRLVVARSDGLSDEQAAQQVMISAFADEQTGKAVVVIVNYRDADVTLDIDATGFPASASAQKPVVYTTSATSDENMKARPLDSLDSEVVCAPRSIMTVTF
ncbi:MAG: hypothetical protein JW993_09105 [Sedimentisphaerales bacterium]|nr:hypothetical protein [Sedimentisphaerales bacterium]